MTGEQTVPVVRVTEEGRTDIEDVVTRELPLTILLNDKELVTLLCSPWDLDSLAVGYLFSEGLLKDKNDVRRLIVDDRRGVVRVETANATEPTDEVFKRLITSGCGRGASFYSSADIQNLAKVESLQVISPHEALALAQNFQHHSQTYRATGGVHSAALCDTRDILVFAEDIGRHNAIDKIFGHCLLKDIPTDDRIILTSGRISSEILFKVVKRKIPILVSISAPTDQGVKLANEFGITLIGFVRGKRMNVYTNAWRVA